VTAIASAPLRCLFTGTIGRIYLLLCLMFFIEYVDRVNLSVAAPLIKSELDLSNTQLGLAFSAFGTCYALFQIVNGTLGDRLGPRLMLTLCGTLWAAGTLMTGFTGGLASLILARLLVGLGEAGTIPTGASAMTRWIPKARRGVAQGVTHASARLAAGLTPPLVVAMIPLFGWRGAFMVLGLASLAWIVAWVVYFRDDPRAHRAITPTELDLLPQVEAMTAAPGFAVYRELVWRILPVTLVFFCHAWTLWLYLSWLPSFLAASYGLDLKDSALFTSGVFLAGMCGDAVGGLLTDAIYRRTRDLNKARRDAVIVGFAGSLLCLLPVLFMHDQTIVILTLGAALFFLEMTEGPIWAVPIDIAPHHAGSAGGVMSTAAGLAATISPFAFGLITDLTGSYRLPFALSIGLLAAGIGLAFLMRPDRPIRAAPGASEAAVVP